MLIFCVHQDLLRYGLSLKNRSELLEKALIFLFKEGISGTALDPSEGYTQDSAFSNRNFLLSNKEELRSKARPHYRICKLFSAVDCLVWSNHYTPVTGFGTLHAWSVSLTYEPFGVSWRSNSYSSPELHIY